jgi:murein DD-endopeptidase MepM/ murein hydrolase activator NlpD
MASLSFRSTRSRLLLVAFAALAVSACSSTRPVASSEPPSGDYFTVPVFYGDTLAIFAARYGVHPNDIIAANRVRQRKSTGLLINNRLRVPATVQAQARTAPAAQSAAVRPAVTAPAQSAMSAPPAEPVVPRTRPASIESRSLAAPPVTSARIASVRTNGLDTQKTPAAPTAPAVTASLPAQPPPAAEPSWYDWFVPVTPPVASPDDTEERFLWPVEGRVISPFGDNPNGGRNDGINISVPRGTPVRAADAGEISYVGNELKGYGNLILIRHDNGFVTAYAHTDGVHVKRGERVERGQVIATVGDTGNVSQPQLHFELRHGTQPVDPTPYLVESPKPPANDSSKRLAEGAG